MTSLHITNPRERAAVRAADLLLTPLGWVPRRARDVRRILLLRLERIGDLLMALEAMADVRAAWPDATIDLAVGSWNAEIAALVPGIATVHVVDVPWLSRGERPTSWGAIIGAARSWRGRYDLAINFEPDIRSNLLAWLSRTPRRAGYASGGGGALLTDIGVYDPTQHVADNARRLVALVAPSSARIASERPSSPAAAPPAADPSAAAQPAAEPPAAVPPIAPRRLTPAPAHVERVGAVLAGRARPFIGMHVSGGRQSKQWHLDRFAAVARTVARETGGTIVLTGSASDAPLVEQVQTQLGDTPTLSVAGALSLPETAALASLLDVLITGDTGPMHLAAAMGAPVVALFGPSDPVRYGPRARSERILRVELPCSPCGQVRLPPERCRGHVPDCMDGISVTAVVDAALALLNRPAIAVAGTRR